MNKKKELILVYPKGTREAQAAQEIAQALTKTDGSVSCYFRPDYMRGNRIATYGTMIHFIDKHPAVAGYVLLAFAGKEYAEDQIYREWMRFGVNHHRAEKKVFIPLLMKDADLKSLPQSVQPFPAIWHEDREWVDHLLDELT